MPADVPLPLHGAGDVLLQSVLAALVTNPCQWDPRRQRHQQQKQDQLRLNRQIVQKGHVAQETERELHTHGKAASLRGF